jgi:hypothetical protein
MHRSLLWMVSLLAAAVMPWPAFAIDPRVLSEVELTDRAQVTFQPLFFCEVLFSLIVAELSAPHSGGVGLGEP